MEMETECHGRKAVIVAREDLDNIDSRFAVVRLDNGKLALMTKEHTQWKPFYPRGIETGFWDFRTYSRTMTDDEYHVLFERYVQLGSNCCWFMVKWQEVEPADGQFDFSFTDRVTRLARMYGIKLVWVFFTHVHCQDEHLEGDDFWAYHLDDRDGQQWALQWVRDAEGRLYDTVEKLNGIRSQLFPCYAHPDVRHRIERVIRKLAAHYRHSDTVIGVQIGNEEGFVHEPFEDGYDSDYNPITQAAFEAWRGGDDRGNWADFKNDSVKRWWRQFTAAFHDEDPYKLTSFNFQGGHSEKGDPKWIFRTGTDASTYGEANLDVVGTMFYEHDYDDIWYNLDQHYRFADELPLLIPSEIGLGIWGTESCALAQHYLVQTLVRGGQGYDFYAYGHFVDEHGGWTRHGEALMSWNRMIAACEEVIWSGMPGGKSLQFSANEGAEAHALTGLGGSAIAIVYFPDAHRKENADSDDSRSDLRIDIHPEHGGLYDVFVYRDGRLEAMEVATVIQDRYSVSLPQTLKRSLVFVHVRPTGAQSPR